MLLNNQTIKYILTILLFSHVLIVNVFSADDVKDVSVFKTLDGVEQVLNLYTDKPFDDYLEDRLHFNISDYQTAINYLFNEYRVEISKIDGCFGVMKEIEQKQNGDWVNDVVAFAGRDYVLENIDSFQKLLSNINRKNSRSFCRENEKDVIFSEVHYLLNFKEFLNEYLSYVETLPENQQKLCEKNVNVAKTIIESMANPPMQTIFYGNRVESYLSVLHKVKLKPEVANYLLNHPAFSKPFNLMQAIGDLRKLMIVK